MEERGGLSVHGDSDNSGIKWRRPLGSEKRDAWVICNIPRS